jgi:urease accessory protein
MLDANTGWAGPESLMQRSRGSAMVSFALRAGQAALADLRQQGSAKAMLPRVAGPVPEVVFLNTSGGLTGGDALSYEIDVGPSARVTATTQTAERAYSSLGAQAQLRVRCRVAAGGRLDWLPQETILYEAAHLHRETVVDLAGDAACLLVESVVLGRQAMGESPRRARLNDSRHITRSGRPVWVERQRLDEDFLRDAGQPALLGGARAFAVVALVAPRAEDALGPVRAVLDEPGCRAAASGWDGKCLVRVTAGDGWPLKRQLARVLAVLTGRPLPRVWQMQGVAP